MRDIINILVTFQHDDDRKQIPAILSAQNDFNIIGIEKDASGTIIKSEQLKPDVLIMDLHLPGISGPELAPIIHRRSSSTAIILICGKDEDCYANMAYKAGISGFLIKEADMDKLIFIVKIVSLGGCYFSASIIAKFFNTNTSANVFQKRETNPKLKEFYSPTERGIVTYIAMGFLDEEISKKLNISVKTVRNYITVIKRKTKLKNRIQIAIFSLLYELISPEKNDVLKNYSQFLSDAIDRFDMDKHCDKK
jgi:DNA-binding NarL/FixJ family response regulator